MRTIVIGVYLLSALSILANDSDEPKWQYSQGSDPMGRGVRKEAMVMSTNFVDFRFPYGGPQQAKLELWNASIRGVFRNQVVLEVERGQFLFRYETVGAVQTLTVRFDDGALQEFTGVQGSSGRTNTLGMVDNDKFIAQLRKAKKVKIEATFFQEGTVVFEFDVHGLEAKSIEPDLGAQR